MVNIRTLLLAGAVAGLGLAGSVGAANASPFNTTFRVSIWNYQCPNCEIDRPVAAGAAEQPGRHGNADALHRHLHRRDELQPGASQHDRRLLHVGWRHELAELLRAISARTLSTGSYGSGANQTTTLMKFSFTIGHSTEIITHDDGISLYNSGDTNRHRT